MSAIADLPESNDADISGCALREVVWPLGGGVDLLLLPQHEFERRREWASSPFYWAARGGYGAMCRRAHGLTKPGSCWWRLRVTGRHPPCKPRHVID